MVSTMMEINEIKTNSDNEDMNEDDILREINSTIE